MTDFLDGVRMGSFDTEYDDDTIEMVLTESAMHLLSQAAAQAESAGAVVGPAGKEPEVQGAAKGHPVADANAIAKAQPVGETLAAPQAQPVAKALITPEAQPGAAARAALEPRPYIKAPADTEKLAAVVKQRVIANDQVPEGYRPPMSTLRFALILSLVAIGSALLTAGTYFLTTRASPPVKVVTIRVPADPAPAVAATPSQAAAIAVTAASATVPPSPAAATAATTAPASPPPGMAAIAPPSPLPATAAPGAAVTALTPATASGPSTDQPATVRFANPFDKREVFEFPPGTSQADARDAVADLLADRARDRRGLLVKTPRRNGKTADSGAPVVASGIAPRS